MYRARLLFSFSLVVMIILFSNIAFAKIQTEDGILFDEKTGTIYGYKGSGEMLDIPEVIKGVIVEVIGEMAFANSDFIRISIPNTVKEIGMGAFELCNSLEEIIVHNSPYFTVQDGVLFTKDLKTMVVYPPGKTDLDYAIPEGAQNLDPSAFNGIFYLEQLSFPSSMTFSNIDGSNIQNIFNLKSINIHEDNPHLKLIDGLLLNKDLSRLLLIAPDASIDSSFHIPDTVVEINRFILSTKEYEEIYFPLGLTKINDFELAGQRYLRLIDLPNSITEIGSGAFSNCQELNEIKLPEKLEIISMFLFNSCTNLQDIIIPENVITIERSAFGSCNSLEEIVIPNNVVSINESAFSPCRILTRIVLGNNLKEIGDYCFKLCVSLEEITIPDSVINIGDRAFFNCENMKKAFISPNVERIGEDAFLGTHEEFFIQCQKDSYAHTYARDNNINFVLVDENGNEITSEIIESTKEIAITSLPIDEIQSDVVEGKSSYVYVLYLLVAIAVIFGIIMIILKKRNSK